MRRLAASTAHALAAEYVVGTLRGRARRRFEAIAAADAEVAAVLREWEAALTPLADRLPGIEPPARVWKAIQARIAPPAPVRTPWWSSLGFRRGFGLAAGGLASVLVAAFLWLSAGPRGEPLFIAVLSADDAAPRMLVSMHHPDVLRVRMMKPMREARGKGLELWVMPVEGAPRSLGMLPNAEGDTIIRITAADPRVRGARALAVTLEPPGGSPTRRPTGPMVCRGPIVPVRRS